MANQYDTDPEQSPAEPWWLFPFCLYSGMLLTTILGMSLVALLDRSMKSKEDQLCPVEHVRRIEFLFPARLVVCYAMLPTFDWVISPAGKWLVEPAKGRE